MPSSPHATASPSMMQDRERSLASASTMSGKRSVKSLPGRLYNFTRLSFLRAMTRKPSNLIPCTHSRPEGVGALLGRHGAMKPDGRARGCDMADFIRRATAASRVHKLGARLLHHRDVA